MLIRQWLNRGRSFGLIWVLCLLAACSPAPQRVADQASVTGGLAQASAPAAPPPPASVAAKIAREDAAPASRLGTQWGEGRESRVRTVEARRITPDRPDDVASIGYNDADGVRKSSGSNPQRQLNLLLAQGDVEWSVLDENNRPLALQRARRGGGMFRVEGRKGARYTLMFRNLSTRSYEVVSTVDGLDVLSGQPGSLRETGYILRPHDTLTIEGFRKSDNEVATFRFAAPERAYAANTEAGDVRNIGVIGAALFELELPGVKRAPRRGAPASQPNPFPADGASRYAPPPNYDR